MLLILERNIHPEDIWFRISLPDRFCKVADRTVAVKLVAFSLLECVYAYACACVQPSCIKRFILFICVK